MRGQNRDRFRGRGCGRRHGHGRELGRGCGCDHGRDRGPDRRGLSRGLFHRGRVPN